MSKNNKKKDTDFRITPFHVNNSVTGSSVLVEVDGLKILLDLGMFQSQTHKLVDIYKINYQKLNIPFEEIISLLHCYSMRLYSKRKGQKIKEILKE